MLTAIQTILLYAILNPATIIAGLYIGLKASEPQKIPIAALIAAIVGMALLGLVGRLNLGFSLGHERAAGGMLIALTLVGLIWATAGYRLRSVLKL